MFRALEFARIEGVPNVGPDRGEIRADVRQALDESLEDLLRIDSGFRASRQIQDLP